MHGEFKLIQVTEWMIKQTKGWVTAYGYQYSHFKGPSPTLCGAQHIFNMFTIEKQS